MKIGIIGYKGFIGSALFKKLSEKYVDAEFYLFGRDKDEILNCPEKGIYTYNFKDTLYDNSNVFDILEYIYYLKSETIPAGSWNHPKMELDLNISVFIDFMEKLNPVNLRKIVFISSAGTVYGMGKRRPKEDDACKPFSPHGIMKLCLEYFLEYYRVKKGINYDIFRISNVYGPGQNTAKGLGVINTMIEKILYEKKIVVFGDGNVYRNFIYIDDVIKILVDFHEKAPGSEPINLCHDDVYSINDIIHILKEIDPDFVVEYKESRKSDNPYAHACNLKLKELLLNIEFTDIREGIKKTYQYLSDQAFKS